MYDSNRKIIIALHNNQFYGITPLYLLQLYSLIEFNFGALNLVQNFTKS